MEEKEKQSNVDVIEEEIENDQSVEEKTDESKASVSEAEFLPLFENDEAEKFRSQWLDIQSRFVDNPGDSVKEADELVADVIKSITRSFADRRISLENQWNSGENNVSTEDLRMSIKRYRSFFNRLLSLRS